jgi:hypothetical protein
MLTASKKSNFENSSANSNFPKSFAASTPRGEKSCSHMKNFYIINYHDRAAKSDMSGGIKKKLFLLLFVVFDNEKNLQARLKRPSRMLGG